MTPGHVANTESYDQLPFILKITQTSNYLECNKWFNSYGLEKELELKFSLGSELAPLEYRKHSTCMHKLVLIAYVSKMYLLFLIMVVLEDPSWS